MSTEITIITNSNLPHKDELDINSNHWVTYTPYVKYFKQTFLFKNKIVSNTPIMMYMSFPGFVTIEPLNHEETFKSAEEAYNQGLRYFNHEFDIIDAKGIKKQNPRLTKEEKMKKIGKELRRMLKTWQMIMNQSGDDLYIKNKSDYQIILKNADNIVNLDNRSDVFFPLCFKEKDKIVGGIYASAWETESNIRNLNENLEFDVFTTGGCLFGNEVFGFDDHGNCHPLTNPRHEITNQGIIQKIDYISDKHSDEIVTIQAFKNLIPLIKSLSATTLPRVVYQIPASEYILNAIHHYIHNRITTQACLDYIELISLKKRDHMNVLYEVATEYDIDIKFESPIDPLINYLKEEDDIIMGLIKLTKLPMIQIFDNELLVVEKILDFLCEHSGKYKPIWRKITNLINDGTIEKATLSLAKLSHISYCANLATPYFDDPKLKVCCIYPGHEKRIQLTYKHLLSKDFGNVFCINWLPPILIKSEEHHNGVFFINSKLNKRVKSILELNIVDHIFKGIGGLAIDDRQFVMEQMEQIFLTLCSVHPRKVIETILKSLVS